MSLKMLAIQCSKHLSVIALTMCGASNLWASARWADDPPATGEGSVTITVAADDEKGEAGKDGDSKQKRIHVRGNAIEAGGGRLRWEVVGDDGKQGETTSRVVIGPIKLNANVKVTDDARPKAWLGVGLKPVEGDLAKFLGNSDGVFVDSVFEGSPAEQAGIKAGDIIVAIDQTSTESPASLVRALREIGATSVKAKDSKQDGDKGDAKADEEIAFGKIEVTVNRQGKEVKLSLTPQSRPTESELERTALDNPLSMGESRLLGFGEPLPLFEKILPVGEQKSRVLSIIKSNQDGKDMEVRVERDESGATKITVKDKDGERELSADKVDELPEQVATQVKKALEGKFGSEAHARAFKVEGFDSAAIEQKIRQQLERAKGDFERARGEFEGKNEALEGALKNLEKMSNVVVISPEAIAGLSKKAQELAEGGMAKANQIAAVPEQVKQLQKQVDSLKKEVEELRNELKASKARK